jgi:hypothetical protein
MIGTAATFNPALRTGQIAALCRVNSRTVCTWIDKGYLRGRRCPPTYMTRIADYKDVVEFFGKYGMPEGWLREFEEQHA